MAERVVTGDAPSESPRPIVSIILLTYNHKQYITAALRSILDQTAAPPHEILVAEDCSTDGTRAVLKELAAAHPQRFTVLPRERNLGLSRNLEDAFGRCRGKYIAILEGDDLWSDPHKLRNVTEAIEAHPEWSGCFHSVRVLRDPPGCLDTQLLPAHFAASSVDVEGLLRRSVDIPSYSCVTYRAGLVHAFPEWHRDLACGDWVLHTLHAEHGPMGFLNEPLTTYRVHESGMWSSMNEVRRWQQNLTAWSRLDEHFQGRYAATIAAAREHFLMGCEATLADLRKIERRYRQLQLHHVAAMVQQWKQWWHGGSEK